MSKVCVKDSPALQGNLERILLKAERYLWRHISRRQLEGYKFRRQQPIGPYIVDFVNFEKKIVLELDGGQHGIEMKKDMERDKWLRGQGFEVLRFWNNEIFENIEGVLEVIRENLLAPSPSSPPTGGGERKNTLIPSHKGRGEKRVFGGYVYGKNPSIYL